MKPFKYLIGVSALMLAHQGNALAGPTGLYQDVGSINPDSYSFTATNTGTVNGYFAGSDAASSEMMGLEINGVLAQDTAGQSWVFNNDITSIGSEVSWNVKAGDQLTLVDAIWGSARVDTPPTPAQPWGGNYWVSAQQLDSNGQPTNFTSSTDNRNSLLYEMSSNPSQNVDGNQHIYSQAFDPNTVASVGYQHPNGNWTGSVNLGAAIPVSGVYASFEDEASTYGNANGTFFDPNVPLYSYAYSSTSDYNYNDLNVVMTNVSVNNPNAGPILGPGISGSGIQSAPEIDANLTALSMGLLSSIMLMMTERRRTR